MPVVSDYTALISGYSWNGMTDPGAPVFVSYAFLDNGEVPSLADYQPYANNGYYEFTTDQRQSFREALNQFELIAGVEFIEVDNPELASIDVMNTSGSQWGGWANYGIATDWYTTEGYIVIDGTGTYAPGTGWYEVLLHEIGHAMGLKHPFSGDPTLDASLDNSDYTLMSYTGNGVYDTSLAPLDVDALHYLYGDQTTISAGWSWNWSDATEQFTLSGAATEDILIGIDAASYINGFGGNDTLWGRDGADILIGGAGNDILNGGSGSDVAVFSGNWSDYSISEIASGIFSLSDNRGAGFDGLDTTSNIEFYQFADGTVAKNDLLSGGSGLPDYIVENVSVSGSSFSPGELITVNYNVTNLGADELGFSDVSIYLSQTGVFDPNVDTLVATNRIPGIFNGTSYVGSDYFAVPSGISGPYSVFVVADTLNEIAESNEANNVSTDLVQINITGPDLTISNLAVTDATLVTGQSTSVTFDLNNIGSEIAGMVGVYTGIYLSTDSTITAADTNLVSFNHTGNDLAAGGALIGNSANITLPGNLAPGTYYIGAIADENDILAEGNEANNATPAPIQITVETATMDLAVSDVQIANSSIAAGEYLNGTSIDISNLGNAPVSLFGVGFYLSADSTVTTDDIFIGSSDNLSLGADGYGFGIGIPPSSSYDNLVINNLRVPVDLTPGTYFIGAIADYNNNILETDETNNVGVSLSTVTVTAPLGVDLAASDVQLSDQALFAGQTLTVTYDIQNLGTEDAHWSNADIFISQDSTFSSDDTIVFQDWLGTIYINETVNDISQIITVPEGLGAGTWYVGVNAIPSNTFLELNPDNNASPVLASFEVLAPTDLSPDGVTVTSGTYITGNTLDVTFDVNNLSVEPSSPYSVSVYLSSDNAVTTSDIEIGSYTLGNLDGGTSLADYLATITLPNDGSIADGNYYVGVIVDPENSTVETDETNNAAVSANTITVHNPIADLVAGDFKQVGGSAEVPTGGDVSFSFDIANTGDLDSGTFDARIYLSTDSTITTGDILLTTVSGLSVAAGATLNDQIANFNIPDYYNLGDYYFGVIVDYNNQVAESLETNNAAGTAISITAAAPGNDPGLASQWYINNPSGYDLNVQDVWGDYTGNGVRLAIIDSGIDYNHVDLSPNYDTTLDYDFGSNDSDAIYEGAESHGTMVAGVAGGASNGLGIIGVAPDLTLFGYRYEATTYAQAVAQWTSALNQATTDADIVNMSLGFQNVQWDLYAGYYLSGAFEDNFQDPAYAAFGAAFENTATNGRGGLGTLITVSAGNELDATGNVNYDNMLNSPYTIAVGSVTSTGTQSYFSNGGAALLVTAPGSNIYTTDPTGAAGGSSGDYTTTNGTSFSAPSVAGVIALMLEANSALGARDVQEILAYSAVGGNTTANGAGNWNGGGIYTSLSYGFGNVDAEAAVRLAETWQDQHTFTNVTELTYASGAVNLAIPDNGAAVTDTITISYPSRFELDHVEVFVDLTHTAIDDLVITITSADGLASILMDTPPTGLYQNFPTNGFTFMSTQFWGEDISGDWTISIQDRASGDIGTLASWSLIFYGDVDDGNDTYFYNDEYSDFVQNGTRNTLTDSDGGIDAINASQVTTASTIDLREGNVSTIDGESLTIAAGTIIEDAFGGDGDDLIRGNASANTLSGGRGGDTLDGGAGEDTADYSSSDAGITVNLSGAGTAYGGHATGDTLISIENVTGSTRFGDTLIGDAGDNRLLGLGGDDFIEGGDGADYLDGGAGHDTVRYFYSTAGVTGNLTSQTAYGGQAEGDTLVNFEELWGSNGYGDNLIGGSTDDVILGWGGDDLIEGYAGADELDGGDGVDTLRYYYSDAAVTVNMVSLRGTGGHADGDIFRNFENLWGSRDFGDTLIGGASDEVIHGWGGDDFIEGYAGADDLTGGDGYDTVRYFYSDAAVTINLQTLTGSGGHADGDILRGFEAVWGSNGFGDTLIGSLNDDELRGWGGNDFIEGAAGADNLNGGAGTDTLRYFYSAEGVIVNLSNNSASGGDAQGDTITAFENLWGSNNAGDILTGDAGINQLRGWGGDDILNGGAGDDHFLGGTGLDIFEFSAGWGNDTIYDFEDGLEVIDMTGAGVSAGAFNVTVSGADAIVDFGTGDTITFTNQAGLIDVNDFDF